MMLVYISLCLFVGLFLGQLLFVDVYFSDISVAEYRKYKNAEPSWLFATVKLPTYINFNTALIKNKE